MPANAIQPYANTAVARATDVLVSGGQTGPQLNVIFNSYHGGQQFNPGSLNTQQAAASPSGPYKSLGTSDIPASGASINIYTQYFSVWGVTGYVDGNKLNSFFIMLGGVLNKRFDNPQTTLSSI